MSPPTLADLVDGIDDALAGRPASRSPTPYLAWLAVCLLRQRRRQIWHHEVVAQRLHDLDDDHGEVPGMPGWRYERHGVGYCLHGADGEALDVDLDDDDARIVDPWFFAYRIESVRGGELPERRLWRWMPRPALIIAALDDLRISDAVVPWEGSHRFHLAAALEARLPAVAAEDFTDAAVAARWQRALGDHDDDATIASHRAWLFDQLDDRTRAWRVLEALPLLVEPPAVRAACARVIAGPVDAAAGTAIEVLRRDPAAPVVAEVRGMLDRVAAATDSPYPGFQACAYLLERGVDRDHVVDRAAELASAAPGASFVADHALLALRFLPDRALPMVRRALRSTTPACVATMAAVLALLDQPWCQRELAAAAADVAADSDARPYLFAALRRSANELARRRARLQDLTPPRGRDILGYTHAEILHASADGLLDHEMDQVEPYATELRGRYPDDWDI